MPIGSGQVSFSNINTELGLSPTAQINFSDINPRNLSGRTSTGSVESLSDFQNKSYTFAVSYTVVGGGGGGGGCGWDGGGGGGGGAGTGTGTYSTQIVNTYPVTVGSFGVGGGRNSDGSLAYGQWNGYYAAGTSGSSSSFVGVSATGGSYGNGGTRYGSGGGGSGGTATGATNNYNGSVGTDGAYGSGGNSGNNLGTGGSYGSQGGGYAAAGTGYGAGGGGFGPHYGNDNYTNPPYAEGGNGAPGVVILSYTNATQKASGGAVTSLGSGSSTVWTHTFTSSDNFVTYSN